MFAACDVFDQALYDPYNQLRLVLVGDGVAPHLARVLTGVQEMVGKWLAATETKWKCITLHTEMWKDYSL